jgi:cytochrome P450
MLLVRMESESKSVNTFAPRQDKIGALTGLQDPARLTEVMEERIVPITIKALSPTGLISSGLQTAFDQALMSIFSELIAKLRDSQGQATIRLSDFVFHSIFRATAAAFFGPTFPSSDPDTWSNFSTLISNIHILNSSISKWPLIARKACSARTAMMKTFARYLESWWYADGYDRIDGISPMVERFLLAAKEEELGLEEAAGCLFSIFWDAVVNVSSTSFWLMAQVLVDDSTSRAIAGEARSRSDYSKARILDSAVHETLRWAPLPQPVRHTAADMAIDVDGNRYIIHSGTQIIADMSDFHFDEDLYVEAQSFNPRRFLDDSLPLPRPFGEGKHMVCPFMRPHLGLRSTNIWYSTSLKCKGMHLAKLQIKSFISNSFRVFEFKVNRGKTGAAHTGTSRTLSDISSPSHELLIEVKCYQK